MPSAPSKVSTRMMRSTISAAPTAHASPASTNSSTSRSRPTPPPNRPPRAAAVPAQPRVQPVKPFIVVNRETRKILAEFETREEAAAFRDGLAGGQANGKRALSIRSTLDGRGNQEAGAVDRADRRGRTT